MIYIIVAMDEDQLIGQAASSNGMPWNLPEDLQHFKNTTVGKTILMGLTTYQAIGRPLPNRKTVVVSFDEFIDER
ncbi:MAG: dihydrofolate reductase, partial [Coprobacillaceae bacterium]